MAPPNKRKRSSSAIYQENRITRTMETPDGKTVSAKSTGVDNRGLHYFTPSDNHRLEFRAKGKVPFSMKTQAMGIDYALSGKEGKSDLLTKEPSDKEINELAAQRKAEYEEKQKKKEQEKREKAKKKTKKKLRTVAGGGGKAAVGMGIRPPVSGPTRKLKMLNKGGSVDYRKGGMVLSTVDHRKNK